MTKNSKLFLSIIITHHRTPELLYLCIKSIKDTIRRINYEVIVVDSESNGLAQDLVQDNYPEVKFITFKKNLGYSKIVNTALKQVKSPYILIINADIIVLKNAASEMLNFMERNPDTGIIAPQLLDFINNIQISCFAKPSLGAILARRTLFGKTKWGKKILEDFTIGDWDRKSTREVDWVQGSALMVRNEAIKKVGLWDERFFMYFEDADWCRRFWQNGYKVIYLSSAKMAHYYHRSSKKFGAILDVFLNKHARTHIISAIRYFLKYYRAKSQILSTKPQTNPKFK